MSQSWSRGGPGGGLSCWLELGKVSRVGFKKGLERAERGERRLVNVDKDVTKDVVECLLKVLEAQLICHNNND